MVVVDDLRGSHPGKSAAPLPHARLLMLKAQALAARPAAGGHEVQAALDASMDLFEQAAARQVKVHPQLLWCLLCCGRINQGLKLRWQGKGRAALPESERLTAEEHLAAVCTAAQLLASQAASMDDDCELKSAAARRRSAFGRVRQLAASAADLLQQCRTARDAEQLTGDDSDAFAAAADLSDLIGLQGARALMKYLLLARWNMFVHNETPLDLVTLTSCAYAGNWQLAARLLPNASRSCCSVPTVLAPESTEHTTLEAVVAAVDAARASPSDGEAGVTNRTQLHLVVAQACHRAADLATAQWHSYEALRLSVQIRASPLHQHSKPMGVSGGEGRGWRALGLRTAALLQGARLCEASGSPEEALDGFKQALKLVRR